jgi:SAM-dependent methyltransferase
MTTPPTAPPRIFTADYYTRMGALEAGSWWNAAMRDTAARLLRDAGLPAEGVALDVGCGSGQTMAWLRSLYPGWRYVGLDVAAEGLRAARAIDEDVLQASALALPFPAGSADLVVTLDVVQHLPFPDGDLAALREMRRVLRPGGVLLLRTNAHAFPHVDDDPAAQFRRYTEAALGDKLVAAGFEPLRLSRINALLGLAEIPRELRARRESGTAGYHGLLAAPRPAGTADRIKRWWLRLEGRAVASGVRLPMGRTILAVCRARA